MKVALQDTEMEAIMNKISWRLQEATSWRRYETTFQRCGNNLNVSPLTTMAALLAFFRRDSVCQQRPAPGPQNMLF
jgi:hypothetical protein